MKNKLFFLVIMLLIAAGCEHHSETPTGPGPVPSPAGKFAGKLFFHDLVGDQYDIFMADLYIIHKTTTSSGDMVTIKFSSFSQDRLSFKRGISKFKNAEIDGNIKEQLVLNALESLDEVDISQYDFVLKNIENLTEPTSDDFAVAVNSINWIAYVKDPDGRRINHGNTEIVYMNLADRVRHQLTPINGQYGGSNVDPDWKDDNTIVWVHKGRIVEVNLNNLNNVADVIPEMTGLQFDPNYSPDRSMILFNTWIKGKKNSFIKYVLTGEFATVLPQDYFTRYMDDNPTWIFSNARITGHIFMGGKGRIYTRDLQNGNFSIITDGQRDFRYVTPVKLNRLIYLVFSDWTDAHHPKLWIGNVTGTYLRELNQTGDEAVFQVLDLPVPRSEEDMERIAGDYSLKFNHNL